MNKTNPFIPLNFENEESIERLIGTYFEKKENLEEMDFDAVKLNIMDIILHPIYSYLWTIKARYKYVFGSKDNGKSFQCSLRLTTRWLSNPKRNAVVLRKYANLNMNSTLPDVLKILNLLSEISGISQLKPVSAEEHRKSGKKEIFYYTKTAPVELNNSVTGQKIFFTGLDRLASGGLSLKDMTHAIDTIWAEELVDVDNGVGELMDDTSFQKWKVIESTVFRGTRESIYDDSGKEIGQKRRKGLEWVDEEVLFSFNSHNPNHWLLKEIGDKFVPLNPLDREDCDNMRDSIVRTYFDKSFQGGQGLFVMRTSVYLNGGRDKELVEQMRKDDFKSYAYLYLGATKDIGGLAYSGLENYIHTENIDLENIVPISIGIDHANSRDHGDWFAASFLGTDLGNENMDFNEFAKPLFNQMFFYDEYGWNNKNMDFKTDVDFANELLNKLTQYVREYPHFRNHIIIYGLSFVVDTSAGSFMQTLYGEVIARIKRDVEHSEWLSKIVIVPVEGKNTSILIDGVKVKARKARVERNKRLLQNNMIVFDHKAYMTKKEFYMTSYDLDMEVIDKNRDFVDAMDYASMIQYYQDRFNYAILAKEKIRKNNQY